MRICGILKVALREDDPGAKLRLTPEDVEGETVQGKPLEPGLYSCSRDAVEKFGPRVIARLKKEGVLPADADAATIPPSMLM